VFAALAFNQVVLALALDDVGLFVFPCGYTLLDHVPFLIETVLCEFVASDHVQEIVKTYLEQFAFHCQYL
jgi:hypothetical protein